MTVSVQIRNVPEELVAELKARAAARRQSLSDYLLGELEQIAARTSMNELLERMAARPRRNLSVSGADLVHEGRREAGWE